MKHSSKGRKRKVFKKGKTHISFTGKSVTSNAGMALVSRTFEAFHISELLKAVTKDLDQNKRHPTHKLLQQLIALRIIGGKVIQDTSLLGKPALKVLFQWDSIADPTTYGRRFKKMTWRHNLEVEQVIGEIKNDFAATGIRTNDFWANDALFQTGLIAYNLLNCIRRLTLPKGLRTARIKRLGPDKTPWSSAVPFACQCHCQKSPVMD